MGVIGRAAAKRPDGSFLQCSDLGAELFLVMGDARICLIGRPAAVELGPVRQRRWQGVRILKGAQNFVRQGYPLVIGEHVKIWNLGGPHAWQGSHTVPAGKSAPFSSNGPSAIGRERGVGHRCERLSPMRCRGKSHGSRRLAVLRKLKGIDVRQCCTNMMLSSAVDNPRFTVQRPATA